MAAELTYALITPYSLHKSRTGGIIGRLFGLTHLWFVGARMYSFSDELVDRYRDTIAEMDLDDEFKRAWVQYVDENLRRQNPLGISNRVMLLLFRGEHAVSRLKDDVVGSLTKQIQGNTIRQTYGDYLVDGDGHTRYFEPAVITAADPEANRKQLQLLAEYADSDGGVVEDAVQFAPGEEPETSLVILKPELFERPSRWAGNIIDVFSSSGCYIVGAKLVRLSVQQAIEFYWPLREQFVDRLKGNIRDVAHDALSQAFDFEIPNAVYEEAVESLKELNAEGEFNKIVEYMTGQDPAHVHSDVERRAPGRNRCLALLYRGVGAIQKIRRWLGSTDPREASPGTVRSDFGRDLMRNSAHASDNLESAERERKIIGLWDSQDADDVVQATEEFLGQTIKVRPR